MSVSSGTRSLFSALFACAIVAGATAYSLENRDLLKRAFGEVSGMARHSAESLASEQSIAEDESGAALEGGDVELKANANGHFETEAEINGRSVDVLIDTGATMVALTYEDAERAGIYLNTNAFTYRTSTANGTAKIAPIQISKITVGNITVRNVAGAVSEPGKLHKTLLGMSFLSRLARVEMRSRSLVLHE